MVCHCEPVRTLAWQSVPRNAQHCVGRRPITLGAQIPIFRPVTNRAMPNGVTTIDHPGTHCQRRPAAKFQFGAQPPCLSLWERWQKSSIFDGEGTLYRDTRSVTCGDSSPKGRAKGAAASVRQTAIFRFVELSRYTQHQISKNPKAEAFGFFRYGTSFKGLIYC